MARKKSNKTEQVMKLITKEEVEVTPQTEPEPELEPELEPEQEIKEQQTMEEKNDKNTEQTYLANLTEHIVKEKADEIMGRLNVCTCSTCKLDVLALALNSLPNKYVTTERGRLHLKLEIYKKQYETDVVSALTKASVRVKASPRHEK